MLKTYFAMQYLPRVYRRGALVAILCCCIVGLSACGTILYPERRGQTSGRIDVGVAVLDGIGLLFFLVPGVIAYAVDFATGTIYLPGSATANGHFKLDHAIAIHSGDQHLDAATIQRIIKRRTGRSVSMTNSQLRVRRSSSEQWRPLDKLLARRRYAGLSHFR